MSQTTTGVTAIGRVIVPVSDQDRALEFYCGTLGFEKRADIPFGEGNRWVEVAPPGGQTALAIVPPMPPQQVGVPTNVSLSTPDIDTLYEEWRSRGVDVDELQRMGDPVPPMFFFRDPDGNVLFVTEEPQS